MRNPDKSYSPHRGQPQASSGISTSILKVLLSILHRKNTDMLVAGPKSPKSIPSPLDTQFKVCFKVRSSPNSVLAHMFIPRHQ